MLVAALDAETLEECLNEARDDLPRRFYGRVSKVVDIPWRLAAGADFAHPGVEGNKALTTGVGNWYLGQVRRAISRDEEVCRAFTMVTGLLAPPSTLFRPGIALRVLRQALVGRRRIVVPSPPEVPTPEVA